MSTNSYLTKYMSWEGIYLVLSLLIGQIERFEKRFYPKNQDFRFWVYKSLFSLTEAKATLIANKMKLIEKHDDGTILAEQINSINEIINIRNLEFRTLNLSRDHFVYKHITVPFKRFHNLT